MIPRHLLEEAERSLDDFRVVLVNGPRQAGKTTLARLLHQRRGGTYVSLDDPDVLNVALDDPYGFVTGFDTPLVIDEVQRAGDPLIRALKIAVDRDPTPGRYLLTGSSRFLTVPTITESLAGRVRLIDLWPLSQGELRGARETFLDRLFAGLDAVRELDVPSASKSDVLGAVCAGGFPEALRMAARSREAWFADYVDTLLRRDVADLRSLREVGEIQRVVRLTAARTGLVLNTSNLARDADVPRTTLRTYLDLLHTVYLLRLVPAWSTNLTAKVARHPKLFFVDPGLAAGLLGADPAALARPTTPATGPLVETFVVSELVKQLGWSQVRARVYHFRDRSGLEVDVVLEGSDFRVAALEVKAASSAGPRDARVMALMRDRLGDRFVCGVVLHLGESTLPLGERLLSLPLAGLWGS